MKALIVDDEPLARNELQYLLNLNDAIDEIEEAEKHRRNIGEVTLQHI